MRMKRYIQTAYLVRKNKECLESKVKLGKVRKVRKVRQSNESYTKSWVGVQTACLETQGKSRKIRKVRKTGGPNRLNMQETGDPDSMMGQKIYKTLGKSLENKKKVQKKV